MRFFESNGTKHRLDTRVALTLAVLVASLTATGLNGRVDLTTDSTTYLALGRSLFSGEGYRAAAGAPLHTLYPPLFPLLIATSFWLGLSAVWFAKLVSTLSVVAFAGMFSGAVFGRRGVDGGTVCYVSFVALHPLLIASGTEPLTDTLFLLLTISAVLFWDAAQRQGWLGPMHVAAATTALAAFYTRAAGIALIVAMLLSTLWRASRRATVATSLVLVLGILPWFAYTAQAGGDVSYVDYLFNAEAPDSGAGESLGALGLASRVAFSGSRYIGRILGETVLFPWLQGGAPDAAWRIAISLSLAGLLAVGWVSQRGRLSTIHMMYPLVYAAMLVSFPFYTVRFLLPVLPWIVGFCVLGARRVIEIAMRRPVRLNRRSAAAVLTTIVLVSLVATLGLDRNTAPAPGVPGLDGALHWLRDSSDAVSASSSVVCREPGAVAWVVGVPGYRYLQTENPAEQIDYLRKVGAAYLIFDELVEFDGRIGANRYLQEMIRRWPEQFRLLYTVPGTRTLVYAVHLSP